MPHEQPFTFPTHSLRGAGTFPAVSISPVKRFICHFMIVWLALLSGGAHAHAATAAAQELGPIAAHAFEAQIGGEEGTEPSGAAHEPGHADTCSLSQCGHSNATGMLSSVPFRLSDALAGAPLPSAQAWAGREQPNTIERPKWTLTTPAVVNLELTGA